MGSIIPFIIVAVVLYMIFKPRGKPERTARPQQYPGQYPEQYPEQYPGQQRSQQYPQQRSQPQPQQFSQPQTQPYYPERNDPSSSCPPRRRGWLEGWLENLEDVMREDQEEMQGTHRREPPSRSQAQKSVPQKQMRSMVSEQGSARQMPRKTLIEQKSLGQVGRQNKRKEFPEISQGSSQKYATGDGFGSRETAVSTALGPEASPAMHKKAADRTRLKVERASIVQGFIWSQILGDPACKRPSGVRKR